MAKPPRHVPRDTSRRRVWVYIAVTAFVAVDVLLIALALGSTRATDAAEASRPIPNRIQASPPPRFTLNGPALTCGAISHWAGGRPVTRG